MKKQLKKKGSVLIYVLLVMVVGAILVSAMMFMSISETRTSVYQTNNMKAYYIARTGADTMIHRLLTIDSADWGKFYIKHITEPVSFADGTFTVNASRVNDDFIIESTGNYKNASKTVRAVLKWSLFTKLDYAIYAEEAMVDLSMGLLNGPVGSGATIDYGNSSDEAAFRDQSHEYVIFNPEFSPMDYSGVIFPESNVIVNLSNNGDTFTTSESTHFDNVQITHSGASWIIDTTDSQYLYYKYYDKDNNIWKFSLADPDDASIEKWLVIELKNVSQLYGSVEIVGDQNVVFVVDDALAFSGPLILTGSGKVEIDVIDQSYDTTELILPNDIDEFDFTFSTSQSVIGDSSHPERIIIYLADGTTMNFDTNGTLYGYVIGPDAEITMKNGQTRLEGALYGKIVGVTADVDINYVPLDDASNIHLESIQFAYWE